MAATAITIGQYDIYPEVHMKIAILCTAALALSVASGSARAEDRVVELWQCKPRGDATTEEIQALNHKWLQFVNSQVKGGGVRSFMLTNIVGAGEGFSFADSYPDMEAWIAAKAALKTKEGQAVDGALIAATDCARNSLHEMKES